MGVTAGGTDFGDGRFGRRRRGEIIHDHPMTGGGEAQGDDPAQSLRRAGDKGSAGNGW